MLHKCSFSLWNLALLLSFSAAFAGEPANRFNNPSFEFGQTGWQPSKAGKTECRFAVNEEQAVDGRQSALLTLGAAEEWGLQFGQSFPAGEKGKTFTFAAFVQGVKGDAEVRLEIERSAKPWDRVVASPKYQLSNGWQEIHITFRIEKDFPEGWFAYLSCSKPNVQFRADMVRLYEGEYVPYKEAVQEHAQAVAVRLFDTAAHSAVRLSGEALLRRTGWTEIPEDNTTHSFTGEAALINDRLGCVLRKGAAGAELYSLAPGTPALRAVLVPVAGSHTATLSSFKILENNLGLNAVETVFVTSQGEQLSLRLSLRMGEPFVQTEALRGATALRVEAPCRFAVLPDFFADDIVIDATQLPVATAELPSDNFLLHLLPDGNAMVMTVVKTSEQDIRVAVSGEKERREIQSTEIRYGKDPSIWVAVLSGQGIWTQQQIAPENAGKMLRLDWKSPFPAQWRVDWRRDRDLTDSWEMLSERPNGGFSRYALFGDPESIGADRKRWTTVLGTFAYPAWIQKDGQAFLQPIKSPALQFEGPAVIYPLTRVPATALDTFTVVDIVRNTLGVGPCEYVLDVEGQRSQNRGRATCSVRDTLGPIYAAKQQKQREAEVEKVLQDLMIFVRFIRGRIESYVTWGHEVLDYLAEQKKAHPELGESIGKLEQLTRTIDAKVAARRKAIKTPEEVAVTVEDFRKTVLGYEGEDALTKCKQFTAAWVDVGGNQDELVGECRWVIKMIRQRAGLLMATDPRLAEVTKEIRRRSQIVLRNPAGHEGARH